MKGNLVKCSIRVMIMAYEHVHSMSLFSARHTLFVPKLERETSKT